MKLTPPSSRPRLPRRRAKKAAGETLVDAVIEEAAAEIAVAAQVEAAVVEVMVAAEETVGVASGAVASAGRRTGRDRRWAPAQDRSRAR